MMIPPKPLTKAAVLVEVTRYLAAMADFAKDEPTIVPRWMRLRSRCYFLLRHGGQMGSHWRIVQSGSVDTLRAGWSRHLKKIRWGGLALVGLEYTYSEPDPQTVPLEVIEFWAEATNRSPRSKPNGKA